MSDKEIKPFEGEIVAPAETLGKEISEAGKRGGVFIGTLNIMTTPGRSFLTEPLANIYKSRYHGKFKRPKHVFAFDLGLVALGAALAIVSIYFGLIYKPFEPVSAKLALLPNAPVSGSEVILNLTVANNSADPITDVTATFKLPPELKMKRSSLPYQRDSNKINFDAIAGGADVSERIVADLNGTVGQTIKTIATITYKESRTGKTVTKGASGSVKIAGSSVGAEFQLPENAVVGQELAGTIRYWNRGGAPIDNVVIVPVWPQNFVVSSSDPALRNNTWSVGTLAPGSEGKLAFSGTLGAGDAADFGVEAGVRSGSDILTQAQNIKTINVTDPQISVRLDGDAWTVLSGHMIFTATYKNSGSHTLTDAAVNAVAGPGFSIISVEKIPSADIKPGASGSFKINALVDRKLATDAKNPVDPQLAVHAVLAGKLDGQQDVSISSPAWTVKIASDLNLSSGARYWSDSGDQLGRGPLPPEVGKTTRYWVFWNIKNTTGAVNGVQVSGTLPANVAFTGKASVPFGDAPIYDPATRVLTWNAGDIPAWPGVTSPAIGAAFEVSVTPTADEIGTYPLLMKGQNITGMDAATGMKFSVYILDLAANLTSDPQAAGTGPVK